ncbi:rhomboid family intramembrane serine protease GlpG [Motilimonas cestriensis]|uniref:Rhomboid family intramembrane serine protease GlpG n=1 Tax=Motilimonas cestriensis TaxID=2742685 RepID=A0ABS8W8I4_9GAMM|nr:rhomboid family intramembrane serine protease GlpG [Motilimonas cestriensis]MCE2594124.1 rhomboid family intramembrane serine protease GlpG [Motilimonas cestriensis]
MRELAALDNPRAAQAFADYMQTQGVACLLRKGETSVVIEVEEHSYDLALAELKSFVQNPTDEKYLSANWGRSKLGDDELAFHDRALLLLRDFVFHAGPFTLLIFALCCLVYILTISGFFRPVYESLQFFRYTSSFHSMEIWRFFSPSLLHFGVLHIVFNLLWWWQLGGLIEQNKSSAKLLLLFLAASIIPNTVQFFLEGPDFGGLSGVVYALAGYVWLTGIRNPQGGLSLPNPLMIFMVAWLVLGFFDVIGPPVANMVHFFGLAIGLAQAAWETRNRNITPVP